ncbi:hypothetical protein PISMIDRAFT_671840 [Pisolithus microcarpus 441]|uniref:Uncharacterized protein n=1 Tax=Pisolithus microcarpus 441 TaxID=765257 RepID=A0A0C9ZKH3_9AGAM|nr:hypothetical protein PISMIDRAFT_671840 [Pisolithus microcarpus 441]
MRDINHARNYGALMVLEGYGPLNPNKAQSPSIGCSSTERIHRTRFTGQVLLSGYVTLTGTCRIPRRRKP